MNNRQLVDYILSNKLKEDEVIKRIVKYEDEEYIAYIYNDGFSLYDDNGEVGIMSFCDEKPNLSGSFTYNYIYEVISKEKAKQEIEDKRKQEEIKRLENKLKELKGEKY